MCVCVCVCAQRAVFAMQECSIHLTSEQLSGVHECILCVSLVLAHSNSHPHNACLQPALYVWICVYSRECISLLPRTFCGLFSVHNAAMRALKLTHFTISVCMYIYIYIHMGMQLYKCRVMVTRAQRSDERTEIYAFYNQYVCIGQHVCVCVCECICTCVISRRQDYNAAMYTLQLTHLPVSPYIYIYIYIIHTHTYTYIHSHICKQSCSNANTQASFHAHTLVYAKHDSNKPFSCSCKS